MTRDEWAQIASALEKSWTINRQSVNAGLLSADSRATLETTAGAQDSNNVFSDISHISKGEASYSPASVYLESLEATPYRSSGQDLVRTAPESLSASTVNSAPQPPAAASPALEIEALASVLRTQQELVSQANLGAAAPPKTSQTATDTGGSTAETVLKTIGMVAGVGPVVTGLLKLFGGSDDKPTPPTLVPYSAPQAVSVDAALDSNRDISSVGYSQSGQARSTATQPPAQSTAQIQINVQAMDSRSFMDHSDAIAAAVRSAMLRSNSLNDVISEV